MLRRALARLRLYPKVDKYRFPELIFGKLKPLEDLSHSKVYGNTKGFKLTGTPVYPGNVVGRCCSIKDLSQIKELKNGDILVTTSTDIGWSPYFPMISGIVTELGGLISHGS